MSKWWTKSWNPTTGCSKISEACDHCYAERMARRFAGRAGYPGGKDYFKPTFHPHRLEEPFKWKKAGRIFVGNMGDIFHDDVPDSFLDEIFFPAYVLADQQWFFLTKRVDRMVEYLSRKSRLGPNVFLGVTAETQAWADRRISELMRVRESQKDVNFFVSVEPMLGPVDLTGSYGVIGRAGSPRIEAIDATGMWMPKLDWVICGGETGPGARPMELIWARSLRDQCAAAEVPFFFKQLGYASSMPDHYFLKHGKEAARLLDGKLWNEFPETRTGEMRSRIQGD